MVSINGDTSKFQSGWFNIGLFHGKSWCFWVYRYTPISGNLQIWTLRCSSRCHVCFSSLKSQQLSQNCICHLYIYIWMLMYIYTHTFLRSSNCVSFVALAQKNPGWSQFWCIPFSTDLHGHGDFPANFWGHWRVSPTVSPSVLCTHQVCTLLANDVDFFGSNWGEITICSGKIAEIWTDHSPFPLLITKVFGEVKCNYTLLQQEGVP